MEDALIDDAWKDSFDKLLEPKPILRQLNIIKKDVRVSYNLDSSVENTKQDCFNESTSPVQKTDHLTLDLLTINAKRGFGSISTPVVNRLTVNPFCCSLSPIGDWNLGTNGSNNRLTSNKLEVISKEVSQDSITEILKQNLKTKNKKPPPSPAKRVCFDTLLNESIFERNTRKGLSSKSTHGRSSQSTVPTLQPGKWRKSLCTWLRTRQLEVEIRQSAKQKLSASHQSILLDSVEFIAVLPSVGKRKSIYIKTERSSKKSSLIPATSCAFKKEILKCCGQKKTLLFEELYSETNMIKCNKIGEGAYGEVFLNHVLNSKTDIVLKIIPIEGSTKVNGEIQKTFEQILPEIVISKELCALRNDKNTNATNGFIEIKKVSLVKGKYPKHLVKLWEKYDKEKISENDHPKIFDDSQLYIVLELEFAGVDLASFEFTNAEQAYYALMQINLTLAIGEEAYQFEHRDLHWGNILIISTDEKNVKYKINNKNLTIPTKGIRTTIIDYTLSRMTFNDMCLYNDLSSDEELFKATGDYQYDIYRMMRNELKNNWSRFEPKTNVFWISYIISKLINGVNYKNVHTKVHKTHIQKLRSLNKLVLNFKSACECAKYLRKI